MASTIKVNNIQNQCGANIVNKASTTITLGASGDTIQLACGASQTGFGRTGTVDWDTTAKTANFTAVSGTGYFVNTTSAAITVTLPAGSAGSIVGISDYASTAQTNNITVTPNGTDKINGVNDNYTIATQGLAVTLVYVDATKGWKSVTGSDADATGQVAAFVAATGGTVSCCGDYKIHTFTGPGTFTVTCAGNAAGSNTVDYLVVAGGGSGSAKGPGDGGGGGGAGGFRYSNSTFPVACAPGSPLANATGLPVTAIGYPIVVGSGGAGNPNPGGSCAPSGNGSDGSISSFSTITSTGGGRGGYNLVRTSATGFPGGSGGGAGSGSGPGPTQPGGTGNTPPVSPPQGQPGGLFTWPGSGPNSIAAGGGGAIAAGDGAPPTSLHPGGAGAGVPSAFGTSGQNCGSYYYFAGGGGGGRREGGCSSGGIGGGAGSGNPGGSGTSNTGGGGGGGAGDGSSSAGGSGGSGIVIIRYKFQ